jgi:hypothetical protein
LREEECQRIKELARVSGVAPEIVDDYLHRYNELVSQPLHSLKQLESDPARYLTGIAETTGALYELRREFERRVTQELGNSE